jgi:phage head maturation protease
VDIEHDGSPEWLAGRIIYAEINSRGFYYVAYVPRSYAHYDIVLNLLKEGILQGFSKMGYATDWDWIYDKKTGEFLYEIIREFKLLKMSLVTTPANGIPFERLQETKQNALVFKNTTLKDIKNANTPADEMAKMFN